MTCQCSRSCYAVADGCKRDGASVQLSGAVVDVSKLVEAQPALLLQAAVEHDSGVSPGWSHFVCGFASACNLSC